MRGASITGIGTADKDSVFLDITEPETEVEIEVDHIHGVLYVHMEGRTVFRICRSKSFKVTEHNKELK